MIAQVPFKTCYNFSSTRMGRKTLADNVSRETLSKKSRFVNLYRSAFKSTIYSLQILSSGDADEPKECHWPFKDQTHRLAAIKASEDVTYLSAPRYMLLHH